MSESVYGSDRRPMTPLQIVVPEVALVLLIAFSPQLTPLLRFTISLALIAAVLHIMLSYSTNDLATDYSIGSALLGPVIFYIPTLVWFSDPMRDFKYLRDPNPSSLASRPLYSRIWNAWCVLRNWRFVGWNVQVSMQFERRNGGCPFEGN